MSTVKSNAFVTSLVAGGCAGTSVDVILFPLDTIKTRLQCANGFKAAGGFRGIYSGLGPAALASAPNAAVFFCTYEAMKKKFEHVPSKYESLVHMSAAATGEVVACIIRVPVEIIKQRRQAQLFDSSFQAFRHLIKTENFSGLYRGYFSTVIREIPFSFIQFPLWEYLKKHWSNKQGRQVEPWQSSICGAISGGFSAFLTTPLDVAKTRIMLADHNSSLAKGSVINALQHVFREKGFKGLFAGTLPRTIWISLGGAIFLGVYEKVKSMYSSFGNVIIFDR